MERTKRKRVIVALFSVAILAFVVGGVARIKHTETGLPWLDGVVGIMGGIYLCCLGLAAMLSNYRELRELTQPYNGSYGRGFWGFVIGLLLCLVGLWAFVLGLSEILNGHL